jgi:hypothetical protein
MMTAGEFTMHDVLRLRARRRPPGRPPALPAHLLAVALLYFTYRLPLFYQAGNLRGVLSYTLLIVLATYELARVFRWQAYYNTDKYAALRAPVIPRMHWQLIAAMWAISSWKDLGLGPNASFDPVVVMLDIVIVAICLQQAKDAP